MSTLRVASIIHPSASSGGLALSSAGNVTGAGLDLITAQSFTGASAVSVNSCFTSTYETYRVIFSASASTATGLNARLRSSGADNTASAYWSLALFIDESANGNYRNNGASNFDLGSIASGIQNLLVMDVSGPNLSAHTNVAHTVSGSSGTFYRSVFGAARHAVATAFDGLTLFPGTGTITGSLRIYGYRNS